MPYNEKDSLKNKESFLFINIGILLVTSILNFTRAIFMDN